MFFWITLMLVFFSGIATVVLQSAVFGLAAEMPSVYTQASMTGNAIAGLIVCTSSIFTILFSNDKHGDEDICNKPYSVVKSSSFAYFAFATFITLICVLSYNYLSNSKFVQYYLNKSSSTSSSSYSQSNSPNEQLLLSNKSKNKEEIYTIAKIQDLVSQLPKLPFTVCMVFVITIGIFPATISKLSIGNHSSTGFYSIYIPFLFWLFNLGDVLGRATPAFYFYPFHINTLWIASLSRVIFVPLFLLCDLPSTILPTLFPGIIWPIFFMLLFAFTNGYIASCSMMAAPKLIKNSNDLEICGTIMVGYLTLGLFLGSILSFLILPLTN